MTMAFTASIWKLYDNGGLYYGKGGLYENGALTSTLIDYAAQWQK